VHKGRGRERVSTFPRHGGGCGLHSLEASLEEIGAQLFLAVQEVLGDRNVSEQGIELDHAELGDYSADEAAGCHVKGRIPCRDAIRGNSLAEYPEAIDDNVS
jgi:hypothetical protein